VKVFDSENWKSYLEREQWHPASLIQGLSLFPSSREEEKQRVNGCLLSALEWKVNWCRKKSL